MPEPSIHLPSIIESLLFVYGEPIALEKLAQIADVKKEDVSAAIKELKRSYEGRGLVILEHDGKYQLGTKPEHSQFVEKLVKSDFSEELSRAAIETISIIAYKGPISRADIEYIRGINSSFTLRNLLMRGLVERVENPRDARMYLYKVSFRFLQYLGIMRVEDLPGFDEFSKTAIEIFQNNAGGSEEESAPA